jgi:hypothetical protein
MTLYFPPLPAEFCVAETSAGAALPPPRSISEPLTPRSPQSPPHSLRHTAASLAISAGATVLSVQRMLGHASAAMTLDVYSDLFDDDLDAVAEALNDRAVKTNVGKMWAKESERATAEASNDPNQAPDRNI